MNEHHYFVIHFDRKSQPDRNDPYLQKLRKLPRVRLIENSVNVQWGSFATVEATLLLMQKACRFADIQYFHLISGQCRHVKPINYIHEYFSNRRGTEFIGCTSLQEVPAFNSRFSIFHWHDYYNLRSTHWKDVTIRKLTNAARAMQKLAGRAGLHRGLPEGFPAVYIGSAWWSLTADCCRYILDYVDENPQIVKRFRYTQLADEMFFQTLIMQSEFSNYVEPGNLRFITFKTRHAEELTLEHRQEVSAPDILFARKITNKSAGLMAYIRKNAMARLLT